MYRDSAGQSKLGNEVSAHLLDYNSNRVSSRRTPFRKKPLQLSKKDREFVLLKVIEAINLCWLERGEYPEQLYEIQLNPFKTLGKVPYSLCNVNQVRNGRILSYYSSGQILEILKNLY